MVKSNWLYDNKYFVGLGLTLVIIGVVLYKTRTKKETNKTIMEEGNNTEAVGTLIYSYPKTKLDSYSLVIVFGGINYANPKWMLGETPKSLLSKAVFVFVPYTTPYADAKKQIDSYLATKNIKTNSVSVLGFSAGGLNVQKAPQKDFKFVGLIDPSTRSEYVGLPFTNIAKMVYNDANWGTLPKIKEVLPKLAQAVKSGGGESEKVSLAHAKIPSYFFNKYKDQIV
jgi:hypothetical protein